MVYTLITGVSSGLGKACMEYFGARGHNILGSVGRASCNFAKKNEVEMFAQTLSSKPIDIVIHCAGGGFGYRDDFPTWEQMEELYRVNVIAPAIINKALVPGMVKKGQGNIIHVSSVAARFATSSVGYSGVKAAVLAYVRILGRSLAKDGIIVTGIIPGSFIAEGNNWDRYTQEKAPFLKECIASCPKGRLGQVEELLPIIEFLASDKASMMCGCCVPADGGEGVSFP